MRDSSVAMLPERLDAGPLAMARHRLEDLDEAHAAVVASYPELHQWMEWAQSVPTREEIGEFLERSIAAFDADDGWNYFLREGVDGPIVGGPGLHRRGGPSDVEIGYWVRSDRSGRGYATTASRILTTAAFAAPLGVERVRICMDAANGASAAVPCKLGFELVEEVDREIVTPGQTGHGFVWAVERASWPTTEAKD
jgi:ribosomal-protein-serine acetyltransferase